MISLLTSFFSVRTWPYIIAQIRWQGSQEAIWVMPLVSSRFPKVTSIPFMASLRVPSTTLCLHLFSKSTNTAPSILSIGKLTIGEVGAALVSPKHPQLKFILDDVAMAS